MKSVKFLRSVLVYGDHREKGSVHAIETRDALTLIQDGAAEFCKALKNASPETSSAKHPAKETASRKNK